jgi:hypothetical protein
MAAPSPNQICAYRLSITMKFFQCVTIHLYTSKTWIRILCVSVGHVWFYACSSIWLSIQSSSSCYLLIISFKSGKRLEIVCPVPSTYFQAFLKYSSLTFKSSLANHVSECYPCFQWPFSHLLNIDLFLSFPHCLSLPVRWPVADDFLAIWSESQKVNGRAGGCPYM